MGSEESKAAESAWEVELSHLELPTVSSRLSAAIEERGLVISGQDLGPGVEAAWGDLDYEYWLVVERKNLGRVCDELARKLDRRIDIPEDPEQRDRLLLDLMKRAWVRGVFETDVEFRSWLDSIDVPSEFSSYV